MTWLLWLFTVRPSSSLWYSLSLVFLNWHLPLIIIFLLYLRYIGMLIKAYCCFFYCMKSQMSHFLTSFRSLIKLHLFSEIFPGHVYKTILFPKSVSLTPTTEFLSTQYWIPCAIAYSLFSLNNTSPLRLIIS